MKSKIILLSSVVAMLVACNNDEVVQTNASNSEISFAPVISKITRALDVTTAGLDSFTVTAIKNGTNTAYFNNVGFVNAGTSFGSNPKYYWPATEALDFYAYATKRVANPSIVNGQFNKVAYNQFVVTPSTDWNNQIDLVYAATKNKTKAANASGVVLNFRHTGAKIKVMVKNTSSTLKFKVSGWKVGYLSPSATFTFGANENTTDGHNNATLSLSDWGSYAAKSAATQYASLFNTKEYAPGATTADLLAGEMILLPQSTPTLTAYASGEDHAPVTNPYIALNLIACNNDATETIVASSANGAPVWATWPLPTTEWQPGKVYTYVIDLAGGGFHPDNKPGTDPELDPLLDEIKFVEVTVDDWTDGGTYPVTNE